MAEQVLVTLDCELLDADEPLLHADDMAALRGDGVFETLLVRRGKALNLEAHLARLAHSAELLDLPETAPSDWRDAVAMAVQRWGDRREGALRLVYSRGRENAGSAITAYVLVSPLNQRVHQARSSGVTVITLERGYASDLKEFAPWLLLGAKTLSYAVNMAAIRYALRNGADDAVFVSSDGYVLEGPRSTVMILRGRELLTPPLDYGVLPGTTQQAVFAMAEEYGFTATYAPLTVVDLINADGAWLVSSVALGARITSLNGIRMPEPAAAVEVARLVDRAVEKAD
ncbi:aminodeoxychorismate lyase [Hoyosella altamirensis]|uniref:4-amino-4-deoxychorismate lyase n=1 Tax=Hoyosella altamirensis TaxID=616997 RepID=A0A839RL13_9ACTN|nr:aminodeoxychorismate lyase [Hoyosella altamirensis]MBB3037385.1 4-amino-4-deoxychorismate lyase [Hoyosella altamirensis]